MEKIIAKIGYIENNYSGLIELPDEVIVVTNKTLEGIKKEMSDALKFSRQVYIDDNEPLPKCLQSNYELVFELEVSALLHSLDGLLTRSALARVTGINEKQLGHYMTGHRKPRADKRRKIVEGIHQIGEKFMSVV